MPVQAYTPCRAAQPPTRTAIRQNLPLSWQDPRMGRSRPARYRPNAQPPRSDWEMALSQVTPPPRSTHRQPRLHPRPADRDTPSKWLSKIQNPPPNQPNLARDYHRRSSLRPCQAHTPAAPIHYEPRMIRIIGLAQRPTHANGPPRTISLPNRACQRTSKIPCRGPTAAARNLLPIKSLRRSCSNF